MLGAFVLQRSWKPAIERAMRRRDVEQLMRSWADDGVFEFGGTHGMSGRFVGKAEIRAWYERWFARMEELRFTVGRVAVVNPWALGLTNTLMFEAHVFERSRDGVSAEADVVAVVDLRRGKIVRLRDHPFDETPELHMWGARSVVRI